MTVEISNISKVLPLLGPWDFVKENTNNQSNIIYELKK